MKMQTKTISKIAMATALLFLGASALAAAGAGIKSRRNTEMTQTKKPLSAMFGRKNNLRTPLNENRGRSKINEVKPDTGKLGEGCLYGDINLDKKITGYIYKGYPVGTDTVCYQDFLILSTTDQQKCLNNNGCPLKCFKAPFKCIDLDCNGELNIIDANAVNNKATKGKFDGNANPSDPNKILWIDKDNNNIIDCHEKIPLDESPTSTVAQPVIKQMKIKVGDNPLIVTSKPKSQGFSYGENFEYDSTDNLKVLAVIEPANETISTLYGFYVQYGGSVSILDDLDYFKKQVTDKIVWSDSLNFEFIAEKNNFTIYGLIKNEDDIYLNTLQKSKLDDAILIKLSKIYISPSPDYSPTSSPTSTPSGDYYSPTSSPTSTP